MKISTSDKYPAKTSMDSYGPSNSGFSCNGPRKASFSFISSFFFISEELSLIVSCHAVIFFSEFRISFPIASRENDSLAGNGASLIPDAVHKALVLTSRSESMEALSIGAPMSKSSFFTWSTI